MTMLVQYWDENLRISLVRDATPDEVASFGRTTVPVPTSVTPSQARLALMAAGLLDQVQLAIDALPDPPRSAAQIQWDFGSTVDRDNPFTIALGQALSLSETQMDDLFTAASGM